MMNDPWFWLLLLLPPALLVLAGALLGRLAHRPWLGAMAVPLAVLVGCTLTIGAIQASPRQLPERLPMLALLLLPPAMLAAPWSRPGGRRPWLAWPLLGLVALVGGWWMSGGLVHGPDVLRALPVTLVVGLAAGLAVWALRGRWQGLVLLPGAALLLHLAGPPGPWADLALMLAVVGLAALALGPSLPPAAGLALGPMLAALVAGPVLALGRGADWAVAVALLLAALMVAAARFGWPWPAIMAVQAALLLAAGLLVTIA